MTAGQENRRWFHGRNDISALGGWGTSEIVDMVAKGVPGTGNSKSKERELSFLYVHPFLNYGQCFLDPEVYTERITKPMAFTLL